MAQPRMPFAATVDESDDAVAETLATLIQSGTASVAGATVKLTPEWPGAARGATGCRTLHHRCFDAVSSGYDDRFVPSMPISRRPRWQRTGAAQGRRTGTPTRIADYDAAVLARLDAIHARVVPIVQGVAEHLPRLASYAAKLDAAHRKILRGQRIWLTRPIIDSYHTVWFELHEELIVACGLTRRGEAEAGHAE